MKKKRKNLNESEWEFEKFATQNRSQRPRPLLDDKIITSWNGLMISAFANAYQVLGKYFDGFDSFDSFDI